MAEIKRVFMVDGKPFYPLGAEADNQSGRNDSESETAFKAVKLLHGNTLEIPVYWEQVEPEEGKFDFTSVDALLAKARRYELKLILLWFATFFGSHMYFAPAWVKTNPQRFKRVVSPTGDALWILSPHCPENLEADKKAFTAFCKHLKAKDSIEHTVIGLQVENEPCIMGSDRDYGPVVQAEFDNPVPAKLVASMKAAGKGKVYDIWQQAGSKKAGTWTELFGWSAGNLMTAWSIATYIDGVAEAGKAVYDIPMYTNVITRYVNVLLDIYKWFTPHIDLISPDTNSLDLRGFEAICTTYSRNDNPFFLCETRIALSLFRAIADYNLIGYHFFGVEYIVAEDGSFRPEYQMLIDSIRCVAAVIPLLLKYQGTGKVHAVMQEEYMTSQEFDFDGYTGLVQFGEGQTPRVIRDWRHPKGMLFGQIPPKERPIDSNRGRGLVIQASRNEFYLVGVNYRLLLRPKLSPDKMQVPLFVDDRMFTMLTTYLSVDEGHFDQNGEFVADRRRNGGQVMHGAWVEPDNGVVRVILCD